MSKKGTNPAENMGWARLETDRFHVIPVNDLQDHEDSDTCWCNPKVYEDGNLVSHNSADGREDFEVVKLVDGTELPIRKPIEV